MFCFKKLVALLQTFERSSGRDYNEWECDSRMPEKKFFKAFLYQND